MTHFFSLLPVIWPWLLLIAAQIAALTAQPRFSLVLLVTFGLTALITGLMSPFALGFVLTGLLWAFLLRNLMGWAGLAGHLMLIIWCVALGAHLLPGFHNPLILDQVRAGPESAAFSMYLNLDKPWVFFAVLLASPGMLTNGMATRKVPLISGMVILPVLFLLGTFAGAVSPEFGIPGWWLIFAISNLFPTCLTEEAFFRGYLQSAFVSKLGATPGIAMASLLFGLAHAGGGIPLVLFAAILGLSCGLGYYATGRLWVPVMMHFGFNALHLILFTYPGPA